VIARPIWFAKCPSVVGRIVGAEFSSVGRDAGAESTASEGSFIQYQWFLELAARRSILIACLLQAIASPLSIGQRRQHLLLVLRHNPTLCSCSIQE
jgi:hypothetical protein